MRKLTDRTLTSAGNSRLFDIQVVLRRMSQIYATVALGRIGNNTQALRRAHRLFGHPRFVESAARAGHYPSAVGRIKMQDLAGAAFLTTVLGGELQVRASF